MSAQQQRYRVIERIAAGGMAEVFRAESAGLEGFKKKVAIKRVLPHLAGKTEFIGMFLDEARLSAHLGHSNCVQVFDIGQGDNTYFIVMEMVDGADLKGVIGHWRDQGRVLPVEEAALICVRICEGLAYAHNLQDDNGTPLNIVHRDMSPPNVLITKYGEVKIADFGLAKANSQLEDSQPGIIKGKFGYLSPEAARGQPVDARTDIFAVGIILWEMLAGRRLFQGKTDLETVKQVQKSVVPDIRQFNPNVPDSIVQVLAKTLTADPAVRYQTARELGDDLNNVLFQLPRAVSSFDIAQLVLPVTAAKAADQAQKAAQGSLIGSLIDQALFEFTSLDEGAEGKPDSGESGSPLDVHSFVGDMPDGGADEPLDWGNSLGLSTAPSAPTSDLERIELGNLSALESHPDMGNVDDIVGATEEQAAPDSLTPPIDQVMPPSVPPEKSGGKGGVVAFIVLLFVLGGAGGAYFSGALPPELVPEAGIASQVKESEAERTKSVKPDGDTGLAPSVERATARVGELDWGENRNGFSIGPSRLI